MIKVSEFSEKNTSRSEDINKIQIEVPRTGVHSRSMLGAVKYKTIISVSVRCVRPMINLEIKFRNN